MSADLDLQYSEQLHFSNATQDSVFLSIVPSEDG